MEARRGNKRIENRIDRDHGRCGLRIRSDESMELAGTGGVRSTHDQFWAGAGHSGPEQNPARRIPRPARLRRTLEAPAERKVGTDDGGNR